MRTRILAVAGTCVLLLAGVASPQGARTFVTFEPMDTVVVAPGHSAPAGFTFQIASGYHINSNQPLTEELIPTQLHFSLPGEISIGKVQYPAGQLTSFPFDPTQKLSVYSGAVTLRAVVSVPTNAAPGTYTVHAELKYQACDNNACYPPKKLPIQFDVKIAKGPRMQKPRGSRSQHP